MNHTGTTSTTFASAAPALGALVRRMLVLAAALCLAAACSVALAQDGDGSDGSDGGDGGETTTTAPAYTVAALDGDGDGTLTSGELATGIFALAAGDDQLLDATEYDALVTNLGIDGASDFATADLNGDDVVSDDQEFTPAVATALHDSWDADGDGAVSADEYRSGWFGALDADGNGAISADEYEPYAAWFGEDFETFGGGGDITEDAFMQDAATME